MSVKALLIDDDEAHSQALIGLLKSLEVDVTWLKNASELERLDASDGFALAFLSLDADGQDTTSIISHPTLQDTGEIILMHDVDAPDRVARGIRSGATYFFCKPFDRTFLQDLIGDFIAETSQHAADDSAMKLQIDQFGLLRGSSRQMLKLYRMLRKVARTDTSVLVAGESGTGKELVAQTLHMFSGRSDQAMVAVNCAAIPKELFESELFGHEKGSFSGAIARHIGYFEQADGGTLFLDELTEMPIDLQAKLLRVLESAEYRRVGGKQALRSNARIIAATNRDPEDAISRGLLREDLYYRVARFPLFVPPLRAREEDQIGLANFFLQSLNQEHGRAVILGDDALKTIRDYDWPGNVRELRSTVEKAFILADNVIGNDMLGITDGVDRSAEDTLQISPTSSIEEAEKALIHAALEVFDQDKNRAAESLGISLKTLYNRLNAYEKESRDEI